MPSLYVVATPIGNLEDITLRALRVLREVKLIAAEDTRKTRILLKKYSINTPMTSYYEHNEKGKLENLLEVLKTRDVALVSEAGMPGISDPGYQLIKAAREKNIPVVPVPGASAGVAALAVSGLPTDRFLFLGFLPHKAVARRRALESAAQEPGTLIIYESPHRLAETLADIKSVLGDRRMAAARELTKVHEEVFYGTVSEAMIRFTEPRGEFTLIIAGFDTASGTQEFGAVMEEIDRLHHAGFTARDAVARLAESSGISKKELYRAWLDKNQA